MQSYSINSQKRKLQVIMVAFIIITMFPPLIVHADVSRTINFSVSYNWGYEEKNDFVLANSGQSVSTTFTGSGNVFARCYQSDYELNNCRYVDKFTVLVASNNPFTYLKSDNSVANGIKYNDLYYAILLSKVGGLYDSFSCAVPKVSVDKSWGTTADIYNVLDSIDLSKDDYKEIVFDTDTAQFSSDIPTPRITVDNNYNFSFNNATDNYYFQIKGRWYSVDDIELYKQSAQWKYKYNSIIKSGLTEWTEKAIKTNTSDLNLATLGKSAFDNFLSQNPIDSRSYTGGTNALGNYFSGYNDALSTVKMLLKQPTTLYNGLEIYVRYFEFDSSGVAHYGKWCHYYDNLADANGSSGSQCDDKDNIFLVNQSSSGLTDEQFNDVENTGNSTKADTDLVPDYNDSGSGSVIIGDADLTSITTTLKSLYSQGQEIINMFGQVFSFLPSWLTAFICTSIGLVCLIGIIKALRG